MPQSSRTPLRIVITGGAGFVGSSLALLLAGERGADVVAFDNLRRRGSELALSRLRAGGVGLSMAKSATSRI